MEYLPGGARRQRGNVVSVSPADAVSLSSVLELDEEEASSASSITPESQASFCSGSCGVGGNLS